MNTGDHGDNGFRQPLVGQNAPVFLQGNRSMRHLPAGDVGNDSGEFVKIPQLITHKIVRFVFVSFFREYGGGRSCQVVPADGVQLPVARVRDERSLLDRRAQPRVDKHFRVQGVPQKRVRDIRGTDRLFRSEMHMRQRDGGLFRKGETV